MAEAVMNLQINLCPSEETIKVILMLLNMWQDAHPEKMVAMVPAKDRYQYEIIDSGRRANDDKREQGSADRTD